MLQSYQTTNKKKTVIKKSSLLRNEDPAEKT